MRMRACIWARARAHVHCARAAACVLGTVWNNGSASSFRQRSANDSCACATTHVHMHVYACMHAAGCSASNRTPVHRCRLGPRAIASAKLSHLRTAASAV